MLFLVMGFLMAFVMGLLLLPAIEHGPFPGGRPRGVDFLGFLKLRFAPGLIPQPVFQPEIVAVIEHNLLCLQPIRFMAATNPAEVFIVIRQTFAAGMTPVMPKGAKIAEADRVGVTGDGFKEVIAVKWKISGGFHDG